MPDHPVEAPPRRLLAVVNPKAGHGRCGRRAPAVLARLRAAGIAVEERVTTAPGEATEIARAAFTAGLRSFAAFGGDGTAYETLSGFLPDALDTGTVCRLALLPLGTGNSFVNHFVLRADGERSGSELVLGALLAGRSRPCDALRLDHTDGRSFALGTVSLGFAAAVANRVNRRLKHLGVLGYTVGVLAELLRLPAPRLVAAVHLRDAETRLDRRTVFAAAQNVVFTGGNMQMAPAADPADGSAELVTLDRVSRLELVRAFPRIFRGTHVDHPAIHLDRFDRIDFEAAPRQRVMLDGEVFELEPRSLRVLAGALRVWI